jgi:hypothetical protein
MRGTGSAPEPQARMRLSEARSRPGASADAALSFPVEISSTTIPSVRWKKYCGAGRTGDAFRVRREPQDRKSALGVTLPTSILLRVDEVAQRKDRREPVSTRNSIASGEKHDRQGRRFEPKHFGRSFGAARGDRVRRHGFRACTHNASR